jgi:hypothetical protein
MGNPEQYQDLVEKDLRPHYPPRILVVEYAKSASHQHKVRRGIFLAGKGMR